MRAQLAGLLQESQQKEAINAALNQEIALLRDKVGLGPAQSEQPRSFAADPGWPTEGVSRHS